MIDYSLILSLKFPGNEWTMAGNSYESLNWLSSLPKPSQKELDSLWPEVQYEIAYEIVEAARAKAYRELSDPLFFEYQRGDNTEQEWLDAVQAVKDAHPYPEAPNA